MLSLLWPRPQPTGGGGGGDVTYVELVDAKSGTTHGTGSWSPAAFTPTAGTYLVAIVGALSNGGAGSFDPATNFTIADTQGKTWTKIGDVGTSGFWGFGLAAWITSTTVAASSTTITFDCGAVDIYNYMAWVCEVAGSDGSTAGYVEDVTGTTDGALTHTLAATPTAADLCLGASFADSSGTLSPTAGSGGVLVSSQGTAGSGDFAVVANDGLASTSFPVFTDRDTGAGSASLAVDFAFIVKASAGAPDTTVTPTSVLQSALVGTATLVNSVQPTSVLQAQTVGTATVVTRVLPTSVAEACLVGTATIATTVAPVAVAMPMTVGTATLRTTVAPTSVLLSATVGSAVIVNRPTPTVVTLVTSVGAPTLINLVAPTAVAQPWTVGTATVGVFTTVTPTAVAQTWTVGTAAIAGIVSETAVLASWSVGSATIVKTVNPTCVTVLWTPTTPGVHAGVWYEDIFGEESSGSAGGFGYGEDPWVSDTYYSVEHRRYICILGTSAIGGGPSHVNDVTISDSQGLTWRSIAREEKSLTEEDSIGMQAWISSVGDASGEITLTFDCGANYIIQYDMCLFAVAQTDGTVRGYTGRNDAVLDGSDTVVLTGTPTTNDVVVYAQYHFSGPNDIQPGAGWDNIATTGGDGYDYGSLAATVHESYTSATISITDVAWAATPPLYHALHQAFIISETVPTGPLTTLPEAVPEVWSVGTPTIISSGTTISGAAVPELMLVGSPVVTASAVAVTTSVLMSCLVGTATVTSALLVQPTVVTLACLVGAPTVIASDTEIGVAVLQSQLVGTAVIRTTFVATAVTEAMLVGTPTVLASALVTTVAVAQTWSVGSATLTGTDSGGGSGTLVGASPHTERLRR